MDTRSLMTWVGAAGLILGCSSGRDVAVKGEVRDPDALASADPVMVAFYERGEAVQAEGEEATEGELSLVHTISLDGVGSFDETVPIAGEKLYALAFVDADGDEACTDGEAWGDTEVTIGEDDTATVSMRVRRAAACPAAAATE